MSEIDPYIEGNKLEVNKQTLIVAQKKIKQVSGKGRSN